MKFILLYRGILGNQNFRLFETKEEAHNYSRSESMIDKEVFGIFELDNPAFVPSFFLTHQLADLSKTATIYSKPIIIETPWIIKRQQSFLLN